MEMSRAFRVPTLVGLFASGVLSGFFLSGTAIRGQGPSSTEIGMQKAIDELMAKEAIREQIHNYARGLDRMDKQLARQVWHPDGTADYLGVYKGTGAGFIDYVWGVHSKMIGHTHQMTNTIIKVDGDKAVSETYVIATLRSEPTPASTSTNAVQARYADRWSKRNGRWAIDHRLTVTDFTTPHESMAPSRRSFMRRDRTDPTYQVFPY